MLFSYRSLFIISVIIETMGALKLQDTLHQAYCKWSCEKTNCQCEMDNKIDFGKFETSADVLSTPNLMCKEDTFIYFNWKNEENTFYFFEFYSDDEEQRSYTQPVDFSPCQVTGLKANTAYTFRLWSVTFAPRFLVKMSNFLNVTTNQRNYEPLPPKSINLDKLLLNIFTYNAIVKWIPNNDFSCSYELVLYENGGDWEQIEINAPKLFYETNFPKLKFDSNYSISIRSKTMDGSKESDQITEYFSTPSCLESYLDLTKCAPERPKNLTVSEELIDKENSLYNVKIQWLAPALQPDYYNASFMNVLPKNFNKLEIHLNISGKETSAVFKKVKLGTYYQVKLEAWSIAGHSPAIVVDCHVLPTALKTNDSKWTTLELVLIIIGPLVFFLTIGIFLMFIGQYKSKRQRSEQRNKYFRELEQKFSESLTQTAFVEEITDKWELNPEMLQLQTVLGEGAFGIVRRGYLKTNENSILEVAIKMLKQSPSIEEVRQFHSEIEIMKSVGSHPHLASIVGCVTKGKPEAPLLVVEYCAKGDLQTYLRNLWEQLTNSQLELEHMDSSGKTFANKVYELHPNLLALPKDLLSYSRQICVGMEYLSSLKVVHRDLAARNVLVCGDGTIKISDFGLSRDIYIDNVYYKTGGGKLPMRWMALESLTHQRYTTQSDVWSFGILLWEIVTLGANPYPGVATKDLLVLLKNGYRMERPSNCSNELYAIMRNCWNASPKKRPTFTELKTTFESLLESFTQYLELDASVYITNIQCEKLHTTTTSERYVKPISLCSFQ